MDNGQKGYLARKDLWDFLMVFEDFSGNGDRGEMFGNLVKRIFKSDYGKIYFDDFLDLIMPVCMNQGYVSNNCLFVRFFLRLNWVG
jgi:hypothetical protein